MALTARLVVARKKHTVAVQKLISRYKGAAGLVIGPGGLRRPEGTGITLQVGAAYWLGASSSPKMVILTKVTDDMVSYKNYPFTGGEIRLERWIAADLLYRGTTTYLRNAGPHIEPELKRSLEALLRGGKGRKEDIDGYARMVMVLTPADDMKGEDLWRAAEEYGGVGGREGPDGYEYHVNTSKKMVEEAKNDRRFKVLKVTKDE